MMGDKKQPAEPIAKEFGRYELLLEMAKGGMATLFLARLSGPKEFEKIVAVKRIHDLYSDEEQFTSMFLDEARLTAKIHHPNVATVFDMGEEDGHYYIAMEYVHGLDLNKVIRAAFRQKRGLTWQHAVRLVADTAAGLHAAHELKGKDGRSLGVVHRDVSPQNILVSFDGHVKVVDFGIAYAAERLTTTASGTVKGKAAYMSPEQVAGKPLDRRSDVFSLGIILWEAVLMRRLFREDSDVATIMRITQGDVPDPRSFRPDLPDSLVRIILRALAQFPEERYQTAGELEEALNRELMRHDEYVAASHISEMMTDLFYDKKQMMNEQIRRAMDVPSSQPMKAIGVSGEPDTSDTVLGVSSMIYKGFHGGLSRAKWLGIAAAVTVGLALLFFVFWGRGSSDAPQKGRSANGAPTAMAPQTKPMDAMGEKPQDPRPARAKVLRVTPIAPRPTPRKRPAAMRPRSVTIRLTVLPKGSRPVVTFRGKDYPGRLFRQVLSAEKGMLRLVIKAPGYQERRLEIDGAADVQRTVRLTPSRPRPAARRRPVYRRRRYWPRRKRPRPRAADLVKGI